MFVFILSESIAAIVKLEPPASVIYRGNGDASLSQLMVLYMMSGMQGSS